MVSCTKTGSSALPGEMSFFPGMSAAVTTATTPGALRTSLEIETAQRAARNRRAADGDMQRADRLGDIVDIFGAALHMLGAAVMRQRLVNMAQRRLEHVAIRRHGRVSGDPTTRVTCGLTPAISASALTMRLPATRLR